MPLLVDGPVIPTKQEILIAEDEQKDSILHSFLIDKSAVPGFFNCVYFRFSFQVDPAAFPQICLLIGKLVFLISVF
jgi:hypothetical protein